MQSSCSPTWMIRITRLLLKKDLVPRTEPVFQGRRNKEMRKQAFCFKASLVIPVHAKVWETLTIEGKSKDTNFSGCPLTFPSPHICLPRSLPSGRCPKGSWTSDNRLWKQAVFWWGLQRWKTFVSMSETDSSQVCSVLGVTLGVSFSFLRQSVGLGVVNSVFLRGRAAFVLLASSFQVFYVFPSLG